MNAEDRKVIKKIARHQDLEENLPLYGGAYINAAYEYSLIRFVLNYYTLKEVEDEGGVILSDEELLKSLEEVHSIVYEALLMENGDKDLSVYEDRLGALRKEITGRMRVLTAYTDALQIYEYVLNRVEYGITKEQYAVDAEALSERVFRYLFSENDKMVINSKIQMVTAQLPVRMTKSRFFDYLTDTLSIYNGSDVAAVEDFVEMLKSTALLTKPEGYGVMYPEIYKLIEQLEQIDYKSLTLTDYQAVMEQFGMTTTHLTELVSNHLLAMEAVNALYSVLLSVPYENCEEDSVKACLSMIRQLHAVFLSRGEIPSEVDEEFDRIEGRQEQLGEDIMQFESILPDILAEAQDELSWIMADRIFGNLEKISKLSANSLFVDLDAAGVELTTADGGFINEKRDELVAAFTSFFEEHPKEVNRAVMGAVFSNMPVLFNSMQETKDYIEHSLTHCRNDSELMACGKILDEMMEEE